MHLPLLFPLASRFGTLSSGRSIAAIGARHIWHWLPPPVIPTAPVVAAAPRSQLRTQSSPSTVLCSTHPQASVSEALARLKASAPAQDSIFALASAPGRAGVSVVRLSGPTARTALQLIAHPKQTPYDKVANRICVEQTPLAVLPPKRTMSLRRIFHPISGEHVDDALVAWFEGPASFTGEDIVELYIHGGRSVIQSALEMLRALPATRLAEPGEFTKRAFFNGKLDLTEVEGLADLINAETQAQRKQALKQMSGFNGQIFEKWRKTIVACMAHVEGVIDFGETEDIQDSVFREASSNVESLMREISSHLDDGYRGERLRSGVSVAIVGSPNAGKSSLLNLLSKRSVAIVSPVAGTTRDVVEVPLDIGGYPLLLSDTAGLRNSPREEIEQEGIRRALQRASECDLKLCVFDALDVSNPDPLVLEQVRPSDSLVVINKIDLAGADRSLQTAHPVIRSCKTVLVSCKTGQGVDVLLAELTGELQRRCESSTGETSIVTQARHREQLALCAESLSHFLDDQTDSAIAAEHLRQAAKCLGRITGRISVDEILDVIFRDFCIGK